MILATATALCLAYPDMVALLHEKYDEREMAIGPVDGGAIATFVAPSGTFTMVLIYADKTACVLAMGVDWMQISMGEPT